MSFSSRKQAFGHKMNQKRHTLKLRDYTAFCRKREILCRNLSYNRRETSLGNPTDSTIHPRHHLPSHLTCEGEMQAIDKLCHCCTKFHDMRNAEELRMRGNPLLASASVLKDEGVLHLSRFRPFFLKWHLRMRNILTQHKERNVFVSSFVVKLFSK